MVGGRREVWLFAAAFASSSPFPCDKGCKADDVPFSTRPRVADSRGSNQDSTAWPSPTLGAVGLDGATPRIFFNRDTTDLSCVTFMNASFRLCVRPGKRGAEGVIRGAVANDALPPGRDA